MQFDSYSALLQQSSRQKLQRKIAAHTLGRTVFKSKYRPKGLYETLEEYKQAPASIDDHIQKIYPGYHAPFRYREIFEDEVMDYVEKNQITQNNDIYLVNLKNGRISSDRGPSIAVFNHEDFLLGEVSFQFSPDEHGKMYHAGPEKNNIFQRKYIEKPLEVKGTVFSLITGGGANHNYYHWFVDSLSRIHLLKESGLFDTVDKFLVQNYEYEFHKESLALLGIGPDKVINGYIHTHVKADNLIVTSHPHQPTFFIPQFLTDFLRDTFMGLDIPMDPGLDTSPLIYISRRDSHHRQVINEDEVFGVLEPYGFKEYNLAEFSIQQKIQLMGQAKVIVATAGAGSTNLFFCHPGTVFLEMFPNYCVEPIFCEVSMNLGLDYHYLVGKNLGGEEPTNRWEAGDLDLLVDIPAFEQQVAEIMGTYTA